MNFKLFHFHLYYPVEEITKATKALEKLAQDKQDIPIGRIWDRPVGPHPIGSCQVTVQKENFLEMIEWFLNNRQGFTVFIHPDTGNDYADHTDHVIWMGKEYRLNIEQFKK